LQIKIYEHIPQEIDELLPFRNQVFGHVSLDHWRAMGCTAVVARDDGQVAGFIPLQFREQCLRPGVTIPVVYENAVGVAEGRRGQGLGSQMMDVAAEFIRDRADAMMVIRSGERTPGYRFYRKTGHGDVAYARDYVLSPETTLPPVDGPGISVLGREQWRKKEPQLLACYEQQCGRFGGGWKRRPGYWARILEGHVFRDRPWSLVVMQSEPDHLAGYMVAVRQKAGSSDEVYIYEIVGEDENTAEQLVRYARSLSPNKGAIVPHVSLANPVRAVLSRLGFEKRDTTPHIMARILCPDRIFARLAADSGLLDTVSLVVNTPHRPLVVNEPENPRYRVIMETKENLLSRLFLCRLNLEAAIEMEMVRWNVDDGGLARALYDLFAFADWVQWFTDYV
jgi:GNAT superfamily N-acetyltransferase